MNGKLKRKARFFYPLCSLLVFVAGWNSCMTVDDILILLGLWSSLFGFCTLVVLFPSYFLIVVKQ